MIISIVIRKGGSGKTTTAINLAAGLADLKKKVLLVDFDPQCDATRNSNIDYKQLENNAYTMLVNEQANIIKFIYETEYKYHIIPSTKELSTGEIQLLREGYTDFLQKRLLPISNNYDFIIIDTPPSESILPINALAASDVVFIPMQTDEAPFEAVADTIEMIEKVKKRINPSLRLGGILPTIHYGVSSVSKLILEEAKEKYGNMILNMVIKHTKEIKEAAYKKVPLLQQNRKYYLESGYFEFVNHILGNGNVQIK